MENISMIKKVVILSGGPRREGNYAILYDQFAKGAKEAGRIGIPMDEMLNWLTFYLNWMEEKNLTGVISKWELGTINIAYFLRCQEVGKSRYLYCGK